MQLSACRTFKTGWILAGVVCFFCATSRSNQITGPNRTRILTSEKTCIATLRTINAAELAFSRSHKPKKYAKTLKELGPKGATLIDAATASGLVNGYRFRLGANMPGGNRADEHYTVTAMPLRPIAGPQQNFFTDDSGVIRSTKENRPATVADPPVDLTVDK
jgi:hypothetical protein